MSGLGGISYTNDPNGSQFATQIDEESNSFTVDPSCEEWGRLTVLHEFANSEINSLIMDEKNEYSCGRRDFCDLIVADNRISSTHFKIARHKRNQTDGTYSERFQIVDCSANGTYLNKNRLKKGVPYYIRGGDKVFLVKPQSHPKAFCGFLFSADAPAIQAPIDNSILEKYEIVQSLGTGTFAQVWLVRSKDNGEELALKVIQLKRLEEMNRDINLIIGEVTMLRSLKHPYIVNVARNLICTKTAMYVFMEYVDGGELFDRLVDENVEYSMLDACQLVYNILAAVRHMHHSGVVHRDLKPENILMANKTTKTSIKLTDFGLAKPVGQGLGTICGTPQYFAPEVVYRCQDGKAPLYGSAADMWSIGVLMFIILTGRQPFPDNENSATFTLSFDDPLFSYPEYQEPKHLLTQLLNKDPKKRFTVDEALDHGWFKQHMSELDPLPVVEATGIRPLSSNIRQGENGMQYFVGASQDVFSAQDEVPTEIPSVVAPPIPQNNNRRKTAQTQMRSLKARMNQKKISTTSASGNTNEKKLPGNMQNGNLNRRRLSMDKMSAPDVQPPPIRSVVHQKEIPQYSTNTNNYNNNNNNNNKNRNNDAFSIIMNKKRTKATTESNNLTTTTNIKRSNSRNSTSQVLSSITSAPTPIEPPSKMSCMESTHLNQTSTIPTSQSTGKLPPVPPLKLTSRKGSGNLKRAEDIPPVPRVVVIENDDSSVVQPPSQPQPVKKTKKKQQLKVSDFFKPVPRKKKVTKKKN